jgi:regulator of protease activity HflC (stomatin/prohibitin superfamily)
MRKKENPMSKIISVLVTVVVIALLALVVSTSGCETIQPGYVGIKVNLWGDQKGVEQLPLLTGRVTYNPVSEHIYTFPTFIQNAVWTASPHEGKPIDESITFNSVEGSAVNADIALAYSFVAEKVPHLFVEFRKDAEEITHGYMRNQVRDSFSRFASVIKVTDIFGQKKQELLVSVKEDLNKALSGKGFRFDMISFVGALRVDKKVEESINAVISASQRAIEAQNKVLQSKAEADQQIEKARGEAESKILQADAEAKSILAKAKAQAEANRLQSQSLNANLLQWNALQKWDGRLPQYTAGGALPFIQLGSPTEK